MSQVLDSLEEARSAAARHAWRQAHESFSQVETAGLTPGDLESYAESAWWTGRLDEAIGLRERAYSGFLAAGDKLGAGRIALALSWDHEGRGAFAVANGWLANAERVLEGEPESPEHARLRLTHALEALFAEGDLPKARELFEEAREIATRVGDRDSQVLGLSGIARTYIKGGEVERGLKLLDEATASAMSGDLRPHSTGIVYCLTISSCRDVGDYRRAAEWTEAANRWCDRLDVSGFPGACRIHRAEVLRLRGDWLAAERQAIAAVEELHDFDRQVTANGHYEVGEIRRRRGDFAGAEQAYRTANELGREPQPGQALLRLAEGKLEAAVAGASRALADVEDPLYRLRHLPAHVEISIAGGDLDAARASAEELERIIDAYKIGDRRTAAFDATLHYALGQLRLAEDDWDAAARELQRARDEWKAVGAPYETAQARHLLGVALRRRGDQHGSTAELEGALAAFERLGATLDAHRVKEALGRVEIQRRTFLFTDIVDSTKLLETLGDAKWRRLLTRHDEIVRGQIVDKGGEVVKKTGDGFFAAFEQPQAAVDAAIGIQQTLASEVFAPDVRIGAHAGESFRSGTESSDYGGQGVHAAARIGSAATAGEILVSRDTLDGLAATFKVAASRTEELKGFEEPVEVVSIDWR